MSRFLDLFDFIKNRMRMSHIYQPVMLTTLLRNDGAASVRQIAQQFAQRDEALIEYYAKITKSMPGRVLGKNHGIVTAVRGEHNDNIAYRLNGYSELAAQQRERRAGPGEVRRYPDARGRAETPPAQAGT
jgi:hypothetical protein